MSVTVADLQQQRSKIKYYYFAVAAYILIAVIAVVRFTPVGLLMTVGTPLVLLFFLRPALRRFESRKADLNQRRVYGRYLKDLTLQEKNIFTRDDVEEGGLIPTQAKGVLSLRGLQGNFRRLSLRAGEISNYHRIDPTDNRNHNLLFLTGVFICIELSADTGLNFRAAGRGLLAHRTIRHFYGEVQKLKPAAGLSASLSEKFDIYTEQGNPVTESMEQLLRNLSACSEDTVSVSIKKDRLYAFIHNRFLSPAFKVTDPVTDESLSISSCPELKRVLEFAEGAAKIAAVKD